MSLWYGKDSPERVRASLARIEARYLRRVERGVRADTGADRLAWARFVADINGALPGPDGRVTA